MAYDVFVVSALEDRDMANLVVRRLRALKFKCWFDKKQTDDTFDQKDARNALNSQSMLVLWSENAVKSDWVRAAASIGHSRPGMLVEIGLDDVVPYDPFSTSTRHDLQGMTTRTTVEGFYEVVEELGRRDGRTDLRTWMNYGKSDGELKAEWIDSHPADPIAIAEQKKQARELTAAQPETKPAKTETKKTDAPAAEDKATGAAGAAATAAAAGASVAATSAAATSKETSTVEIVGSGYGEGVGKVPGTPGAPYIPGRKGPAGVYAAPVAAKSVSSVSKAVSPAVLSQPRPLQAINRWMVPGILAAIALMFLLGGMLRTSSAASSANFAGSTAAMASGGFSGGANASSEIYKVVDTCPAGYISASKIVPMPDTNTKEDEEE